MNSYFFLHIFLNIKFSPLNKLLEFSVAPLYGWLRRSWIATKASPSQSYTMFYRYISLMSHLITVNCLNELIHINIWNVLITVIYYTLIHRHISLHYSNFVLSYKS